jgi:hypothetical protein
MLCAQTCKSQFGNWGFVYHPGEPVSARTRHPIWLSGAVALFEIEGGDLIVMVAIRHPGEDDHDQSRQRPLSVPGSHPLCGFSIARKGSVHQIARRGSPVGGVVAAKGMLCAVRLAHHEAGKTRLGLVTQYVYTTKVHPEQTTGGSKI